ncbi:putative RNA-directed DNA polymerase [Arabidopsis thaliana]
MEPNQKFSQEDGELIDDAEHYRKLVGKLMYLTFTRPDITYAVHKLCQFTSAPRAPHLQAVYKIIYYLKGTVGQGLFYSANVDLKLSAFAYSDFSSCSDSRKSTTRYCMFLGTSLVS